VGGRTRIGPGIEDMIEEGEPRPRHGAEEAVFPDALPSWQGGFEKKIEPTRARGQLRLLAAGDTSRLPLQL
jgi:hypothetical protein